MESLVGVFIGAVLGSFVGWLLLVKENERLESRRVNNVALEGLARAAHGYLEMAADATPGDVDFIARRASTIGRTYLATVSGTFDPAEQQALRKLEADLANAVRDIATAIDRDANIAAYDTWTERLNQQLLVLKRAAYDLSRPGLRSLFRSYG